MKVLLLAIAIIVVPIGNAAVADLAVDTSDFVSPLVVDFSGIGFQTTVGPVQVGDSIGANIMFSSTSMSTVIGNVPGYGLGANGAWNSDLDGFVGSNDLETTVRFDFLDGPVSAVGGFVNYAPNIPEEFVLIALGSNNTVLEQQVVSSIAPISTPGAINAGAFRGIVRQQADIHAFAFSGQFAALDDLTFSISVPEPGVGIFFAVAAAFTLWRRPTVRHQSGCPNSL